MKHDLIKTETSLDSGHYRTIQTCSHPDCDSIVENPEIGLCATHAHEKRKAERQAYKDLSKEKKPIKNVSQSRAIENRQYLKLRKEYLETHPCCEVRECHNRSKEIHHSAGRENGKLLDVNYFFAVCREHHHKITVDSAWSIREGYSILRTTV